MNVSNSIFANVRSHIKPIMSNFHSLEVEGRGSITPALVARLVFVVKMMVLYNPFHLIWTV